MLTDLSESSEVFTAEVTPVVSEVTPTETPVVETPTKTKRKAAKKSTKKSPKASKKSPKKASKKSSKKEATVETPVVTEAIVETVETPVVSEVTPTETPVVEKRSAGRPLKYSGEVGDYILSLYQEIGTVLKTREVLIAPNGSELAKLRNSSLVPEPLTISMPCLSAMIKKSGIPARGPGRPKVEVIVEVETTENVDVSDTIDVTENSADPVVVSVDTVEVDTTVVAASAA